VALSDLTDPTAVLRAIREANELGRENFLTKYGFGPSREYFVEYDGIRYDSKAIAGAAHGFQHPDRGPLRARDFSGGEQTIQRRLEYLGFNVVVDRAGLGAGDAPATAWTEWDLEPGDRIRRLDLHERYGGGGQGGIAPSAQTPNVLVFSDSRAGEKYGYVFDGWRENIFHYTGEGQVGDQLMRSGNRAIRDHEQDGRALRVFKGVRGTVEYDGEFRQIASPYYAEAPDRNGDTRQVIVFQLIRIDGSSSHEEGPTPLVPQAQTIVTEASIEKHQTDSVVVEPATEPWEAVRREQPLVRDYAAFLERRKHMVIRLRVIPEGETVAIVCDLHDKTANVLYEAKGSGTRNAIRIAIGQLADYGRFVIGAQRAVLLPERPRPDLEALLRSQGIQSVWRSGDGFADNAGGALTSI
jgi:hypothetical protein